MVCRGTDYGIWASADSPGSLAGLFDGNASILGSGAQFTLALNVGGNVSISGSLTKFGGGFRIDHPTDTANKYLTHFVCGVAGQEKCVRRHRSA